MHPLRFVALIEERTGPLAEPVLKEILATPKRVEGARVVLELEIAMLLPASSAAPPGASQAVESRQRWLSAPTAGQPQVLTASIAQTSSRLRRAKRDA